MKVYGRENRIPKLLITVGNPVKRRRVCKTDKMEKVEVRVVKKYLCKKGMSPKEIHEDFTETLGKESPSYSMMKKWASKICQKMFKILFQWTMKYKSQRPTTSVIRSFPIFQLSNPIKIIKTDQMVFDIKQNLWTMNVGHRDLLYYEVICHVYLTWKKNLFYGVQDI